MVLYTDGITEAKNRKGEEFGYDRLLKAVGESADGSAEDIQRKIIERLFDFIGDDSINDDYTTVIVRFK